ncbi:uncharacterized protein MONOS_11858 [Monocercomonoides exilis]|uniref:uncharacterized protein n=1 Tax=Monocercomonoides exilis TaxID=2049356 RepID=UPI003559A41A|nr:hypothetical protein MONOS_11858 [Monocercomonoides exilis]|eukprot:MONOS_11858.1-p1 / transcript=MONOS_11858.1 / gene=MONOS_11858 / organism=Monocercomonoides_exilis_PA203 / gene_product=unspecified product / transcript_product=unspecified product / location=Mono_scaffold00619:9817-13120(+) / protein_length=1003 / sequence_SO=supercontig / SO=protein_coding / is_pseudo=false
MAGSNECTKFIVSMILKILCAFNVSVAIVITVFFALSIKQSWGLHLDSFVLTCISSFLFIIMFLGACGSTFEGKEDKKEIFCMRVFLLGTLGTLSLFAYGSLICFCAHSQSVSFFTSRWERISQVASNYPGSLSNLASKVIEIFKNVYVVGSICIAFAFYIFLCYIFGSITVGMRIFVRTTVLTGPVVAIALSVIVIALSASSLTRLSKLHSSSSTTDQTILSRSISLFDSYALVDYQQHSSSSSSSSSSSYSSSSISSSSSSSSSSQSLPPLSSIFRVSYPLLFVLIVWSALSVVVSILATISGIAAPSTQFCAKAVCFVMVVLEGIGFLLLGVGAVVAAKHEWLDREMVSAAETLCGGGGKGNVCESREGDGDFGGWNERYQKGKNNEIGVLTENFTTSFYAHSLLHSLSSSLSSSSFSSSPSFSSSSSLTFSSSKPPHHPIHSATSSNCTTSATSLVCFSAFASSLHSHFCSSITSLLSPCLPSLSQISAFAECPCSSLSSSALPSGVFVEYASLYLRDKKNDKVILLLITLGCVIVLNGLVLFAVGKMAFWRKKRKRGRKKMGKGRKGKEKEKGKGKAANEKGEEANEGKEEEENEEEEEEEEKSRYWWLTPSELDDRKKEIAEERKLPRKEREAHKMQRKARERERKRMALVMDSDGTLTKEAQMMVMAENPRLAHILTKLEKQYGKIKMIYPKKKKKSGVGREKGEGNISFETEKKNRTFQTESGSMQSISSSSLPFDETPSSTPRQSVSSSVPMSNYPSSSPSASASSVSLSLSSHSPLPSSSSSSSSPSSSSSSSSSSTSSSPLLPPLPPFSSSSPILFSPSVSSPLTPFSSSSSSSSPLPPTPLHSPSFPSPSSSSSSPFPSSPFPSSSSSSPSSPLPTTPPPAVRRPHPSTFVPSSLRSSMSISSPPHISDSSQSSSLYSSSLSSYSSSSSSSSSSASSSSFSFSSSSPFPSSSIVDSLSTSTNTPQGNSNKTSLATPEHVINPLFVSSHFK